MAKQRTYSQSTREAAVLVGEQIRLGRKQRRWTERHLAQRAGISRATLQKIESGEMSCAIGLVFETATLVGVKLLEPDGMTVSRRIEYTRDRIALLPQRIRETKKAVRDAEQDAGA